MTSNSTVYCEFGKWEGHPPVCSFFDTTFYLATTVTVNRVVCYSDDNYREIDFSWVLDTGRGGILPRNIYKYTSAGRVEFPMTELNPPKSELNFPIEQHFGAFQFGFNDTRGSMNIVVPKQNVSGDLYFLDPFKVANIGDTVELQLFSSEKFPIRWRHNGLDSPSWNNEDKVKISNVQLSDAGTYECYYEGKGEDRPPAVLRLTVRECKKNLFGEHCNQPCPPCYNGGICHDHLGICVCPTGFKGNHCEVACGKGRHGAECSHRCYATDCVEHLFCKPDPYGCSCAPGFQGFWCRDQCERGWYGADCKQPCHCAYGPRYCDIYTGACRRGGCSSGWTGESCQIQGR